MVWKPVSLIFVLALGLAACGDGGSLADDCSPLTTSTTDLSVKPVIEVPEDMEPPVNLLTCDLVVGSGEEVETGDEITVQYVGVSWSTGEEFDASWDRDEPFQFQIGQGLVIPGWELGMAGARVGSRRELVIPPFQAYGANGRPPVIGENETLVFVIDVLSKDS